MFTYLVSVFISYVLNTKISHNSTSSTLLYKTHGNAQFNNNKKNYKYLKPKTNIWSPKLSTTKFTVVNISCIFTMGIIKYYYNKKKTKICI